MIVLILEGLRRTTGTGLLYTTIFFFVLAMVAGQLPGEFAAKSIPFDRLTYYSVWDSTAVLGITLKIVAGVVVIFVLFGHVLLKSGGAAFFTDVSVALMGRYRGGPARSPSSARRCSAPSPATWCPTSSPSASSPFR